ncbi:hypothetical protein D3C72_1231310 [compost metagenome]
MRELARIAGQGLEFFQAQLAIEQGRPAAVHVLGLLRQHILRRHAFVERVQNLVGCLLGQGGDVFQAVLGVDDLRRRFRQRLVVAQFAQRIVQQAHDTAQALEHRLVGLVDGIGRVARRIGAGHGRRFRRGWRFCRGGCRHGGAGRHGVEQRVEIVIRNHGGSGRGGRRGLSRGRTLRRYFIE